MGYFQVQLRAYSRLEPNLKPGQEDYHSCKGLYPASRCLARRTASWAGAPATGDDWFDGTEKKIHRQRRKHVKIQDESNQEKEKPGGKGRARAVDGTLKTPETGQKALADWEEPLKELLEPHTRLRRKTGCSQSYLQVG